MITGYRFLDAHLDLDQRNLDVRGETTALRPKPFEVMKLIVEARGRVVSKDELLDTVWSGTFVQEGSITRAVSELRQILGTGRGDERYIATVSGVGYRVVPHVEPIHARVSGELGNPRRQPFVGRKSEIEACAAFFGGFRAGGARILCITGEPGIGKSSLMRALIETYEDPAFLICGTARCPEPVEADAGYLPVIDLIESLCEGESFEERRKLLETSAPTWYGDVFGPSTTAAEDTGAARRQHELRSFLEKISESAPVVLFIDDFHWSQRSTLGLILYLASHFEKLPVALVLLYRPTDLILRAHPWVAAKLDLEGRGVCRELPLTLLEGSDVAEYLDLAYPGNQFPEGLAASLYRRTEGHPLFLSSLIDYLESNRLIENTSGWWCLTTESIDAVAELPITVESMVSRQLTLIDPAQRELLTAAALRGAEFEGEVIADAVGKPRNIVRQELDALESIYKLIHHVDPNPLTRPDTLTWYRFSHSLYQQALAASIHGAERQELCGKLARRLGAHYDGTPSPVADRLAFLCEEAREFTEAARLRLAIARRANHRGAVQEAIDNARRGIELLERLPQSRDVTELEILLHVTLAASSRQAGASAEEVDRTVERIQTLSRQIDESRTGLWRLASMLLPGRRSVVPPQDTGR